MAITLQRWPIVGRRPELEMFEQALGSGELTGIVIHGRAGTGKTRLADECREQAAASGHPTERVAGSRTAALLPLGAVAPLLSGGLGLSGSGPEGQFSTLTLFEQTRQALHARHHGSRLVIVADDVALLDAASVALLGYLAVQGTVFLVATVRTGEPVPDLLADLWRDGRMARVDLRDLSRTQVDTLLHLALGGPIEAGAGHELWEITRGNPLYIRELVLGALESGALVERSGVWHLEDRLPDTSRLLDLVEQRIGGLPEQARSVIELLALCEPVELSYLETTVPTEVLESLERAGLVTIAVTDDQVSLAHPMHGKVVRAAMPRLRSRSVLLAQASRLESRYQPRHPAAALRIATWRLDAGGKPDPDILLRGAHLARHAHDFRVVRRLIEAVPADQLDAAGALLLGEALYELGAFEAADRVLAHGQRLAGDDQVALRLAIMRGKNAQWGLCRPEAARDINAAARKVIVSPAATEELIADEACVLTFSGHPDQALAVLSGIAGGSVRTRVVRAIAAAPALALTGQTAEALTVAELGYAEHAALGTELAIAHPAMHLVNQVFALTEAGRLAEAEQLALAGADIVAANRVPVAQIFFAVNLGRVATLQGRLATARRYYAEAAGLAQASRFAGPLRLALSGLALACAMLGDPVAARRALTERESQPPFCFRGPEQELADAWAELVMRRPADAASTFRAAAGIAATTGHLTVESWLLHDLLRVTGQDVSARLDEIAAACDSPLVTARARHARAARTQDAGELAAAAADFEALGAMLLAAEACAGAAEAYTRAGDRRAAAQAMRRASLLVAVCEGAATPGLVHTAGAVPLSGREREIVMLAASGLASKDIAGRLYLSVRTVNNHLQHAYAKLGVSSRAGLAEVLRSGS
ncbi:MAG TPA: LuxR C-terminal-related transcriptional regulator [Streptosporangiaceae bacterium]|nr:LuxR C-terminal-related transcriptional regulator [Streptosporangiaceae bacterium]